MGSLDGRRILITGASSGIGEATARACAERGAQIACLARRKDLLERLTDEIGGTAVVADITDEASVRAAVDDASERLGGLDGLVNNAGVLRHATIVDGAVDDWRTMFDVNVIGLLIATQATLPHLRRADHAGIVNVSSMSGRRVPPGGAGVYSATKFAVHALSTALRRELVDDDVRVTVVAPGFVRTPFGEDGADEAHLERFRERKEALGLDPGRVAATIAHALAEPPDVELIEIALTSTAQES